MNRTIRVKKSWFLWLNENCDGVSGEGSSLVNMRRSVWGKDAYVVRCCKHLFKVDSDIFNYLSKKFENI